MPHDIDDPAEHDGGDTYGRRGLQYCEGDGVAQDYHKAMHWFRRSAEQGNCVAQIALGRMYFDGNPTQDYHEAARWYRLAAEQGDAGCNPDAVTFAQAELGAMYSTGLGVGQDFQEAVRWLHEAAQRGNYNAQVNLARMYHEGKGVAPNNAEAYYWFRAAAAHVEDNEAGVDNDARRGLAFLEREMPAAELERARRLCRERRR